MAKNDTPFSEFFKQQDFSKMFENFKAAPFDMKTFMDSHSKNVQALAQAQQVALENMQALASRQSEVLSQIIEDQSNMAKEMIGEGSPEDKMAKNADLFKTFYERTISNMQELSDMINKSNIEASNIINDRVTASMSEVKAALEKAQKKAA